MLSGARAVRGLAAAHDRLGLPSQRRCSGARHQVRPGAVLVGGHQAGAEHSAHRTGPGRVAAGGEQGGRAGPAVRAGAPASLAVGDLIFPPIVSPTALLIAVVLAVFKPWGLIRKRPATPRDAQ